MSKDTGKYECGSIWWRSLGVVRNLTSNLRDIFLGEAVLFRLQVLDIADLRNFGEIPVIAWPEAASALSHM
jgi:hypothetical protein